MSRIAPMLLLPLLLVLGQGALAQIPGLQAKAEASVSKPAADVVVPIADIASRADEDESYIRDALKRSDSTDKLTALSRELAILKGNIDDLEAKTQANRLATLPISNLETLDHYLDFLDREMRRWHADLQAAAKPVSTAAADIVQMRKLWLGTRESISGDMMPALALRIEALLKELAHTEKEVSQPLAQLLALSREGGLLQSRLAKTTAAVRTQIASVDRKLWQRDSDNLLEALRKADPKKNTSLDLLIDDLSAESNFMGEFDRSSQALSNWIVGLALLSLPLFIGLSSRSKQAFAADAGLERHRKALTRPLSAWLLLTLTVLLVAHFLGPATRLKMLLVLAWLPIMRLQPERLRSLLGGWLYLSGVFILLSLLSYLITSAPLLFRLVVLLNGVLMLAVGGLVLWRLSRAEPSRLRQVLRTMLVAGMGAITIAVVANFAGNVTLASMLTDAMLNSAYIGLFLMAAGNVIRGWARFVFRPTAERLRTRTGHAGGLLDVLSRLFDVALLLTWLYGTLDALRVLRPLQAWVSAVADFSLRFGSISMTVGGIVLFCVSVYLSFWVAKTVRNVLAEDLLPRLTLPRGVANSASTMTYYLLLMLGLVVALAAAGFEISQLAIVLGALSLGIGFGLQTVVNNFVSGLILMFERPIQPGDTVELSGTVGIVREIGMRATTFTTFDGADVVVPNGMLLSEKLINWTLSSSTRRVDVPVGVAYGSNPEQVRTLLLQVAQSVAGVARQPPPSVLFTGFGASSLDFSVRAWSQYDDSPVVRSALALAMHAALNDAGIEIPFPQRDLHLRSVEPELLKQMQGKGQ